MMLGISQRVIWMATPICGVGNPCAMIGTYNGAAKYPITAPRVSTIASELTIVLQSVQASSS